MDTKTDYDSGLLPSEFLSFVKFSAVIGFIAALALTSALAYKGLVKLVGPEKAKEYKWVVVVADLVLLAIFSFIYIVLF